MRTNLGFHAGRLRKREAHCGCENNEDEAYRNKTPSLQQDEFHHQKYFETKWVPSLAECLGFLVCLNVLARL